MSSTSHLSQPVHLEAGDHVAAYRIERKLGSGGMADVYYGVHEGLQRPAAIKVLRPSLAADEVHLQRFFQEARAAASLIHPNIVQVYDVGQDGDLRYIAQEFVAGSNLKQYMTLAAAESTAGAGSTYSSETQRRHVDAPLQSGPSSTEKPPADDHPRGETPSADSATPHGGSPPPLKSHQPSGPPTRRLGIRETLSILLQVLSALNKSAALSIVHRDIKPENIMLNKEGDVKVADFGLARILMGDDPQLTRAGTTLGTPMYMSPEQIQEGQVDIRSDLYSLGVTLYQMLTGQPPYTGETPLALAMKHVQAPIPCITDLREDLPRSLTQLVTRLLAKQPEQRFSNPAEVLEFLREQRQTDLAEDWPEQTIPLPDVSLVNHPGPLDVTLQLQRALRKRRGIKHRRLAFRIATGVLLATGFAFGAVASYSPPDRIFETESNLYSGIARADTVEQQYRQALLDGSDNRLAKWEAVGHYFPKQASPLNRLYVGLAQVQIARQQREVGDAEKAKPLLESIHRDVQMPSVIRALALIETAALESERGNEAAASRAIQQARQLGNNDGFNVNDRQQLDRAAQTLPEGPRSQWFGQ